jgi:hypothetical protein
MIAGNGALNAKIATKAATAIAHSGALCSVRRPMRHAAWPTIAITAGFTP